MAIHEQKEEKYGAMGENGETIKIGTVVQHPVARPPCLLFYSLPNEDTRRASRDDAMVNKKKRGGGKGETMFHLAHSETAEGSFWHNAGFREKCTQGCRQFDCHRKLAKWGVFSFEGMTIAREKTKKKKKKLHSALKPSCTTLKVSCNAIVYQYVQITNSTPI